MENGYLEGAFLDNRLGVYTLLQLCETIENGVLVFSTYGVHFNEGVVISMRDSFIPRKKFVDKIIEMARASNIPFQLEVEAYGGSDGREIQMSPYPIDWCFIGLPEENPHSPVEKVTLSDLESMIKLYQYLLQYL
ncbi:hypothetical protein [uncultured Cyclobacterium sp.]|uniref:hypothetical protein n=1 Tax=uncultured Cyclobacterium sp. TaxID=453820 RepID=UPI0030EB9B4B